ncbi:hypothetical protein [Glycomyces sp. MUSA5-2]|uniref:hypothetical protein n=1 Tax=Glycomyces sp. MUSA5-2 TaxID=2053002 RepID=UPI00300A9C9E
MAAKSTRFVDRIAAHHRQVTWGLLLAGLVLAALAVYVQSWLDGGLTLVSAIGFLLGFRLWVGTRPGGVPDRHRPPRRQGSGALTSRIKAVRARRWRREVGSVLTRSDLSLAAKLELVDLLCERRDAAAAADMLYWARDPRVPAEARLDIAVLAARANLQEGVDLLRQFAGDARHVPANVRFDAAEALLWYDEVTADLNLESLGRSTDVPDTLRVEAAAILSERVRQGTTSLDRVEVISLLVADASVGPWARVEACKILRAHGVKRYRPALWLLANDSRLPAPQRLWCGGRLAEVDPDSGAGAWTALVHDPKLPIWARIEAAARLGAVAEGQGALALRALLEIPDLDERERFEVVRKLTLLDLPQVNGLRRTNCATRSGNH